MAKLLTFAGVILAGSVSAQEAVHELLNNRPSAPVLQQEDQGYTFKIKDFKVLTSASLGMDYNDNINLAKSNQQSDFILRPMVNADGHWPITDRNSLTFNVGVGYDEYLDHSDYSGLSLTSGSAVAYDMEIGDFKINLHDRFSYSKDAARQSQIAGNGRYGQANNTVGLSTTWDLGDLFFTLGYDHQNTFSPSKTAQIYQSQDHSSEIITARSGLNLNPELTVGIEGTGDFTTYTERVLNNNKSYNMGGYADWHRQNFSIAPRLGYSIFDFQHTSSSIQTGSSDSWYADLTSSYKFTKTVSDSLSAGHEVRLGIESDAVETYYLNDQISWAVIEGGSLGLGVNYENGKQGIGNQVGNLAEDYDYTGATLSFRYQLTKKLSSEIHYRLTLRSSSNAERDYTQDVVGLQLTYLFD